MASLTETAYYARKAINWTILAVIAYLILRFLLTLAITTYLAIFPPKGPPPNFAFGKLPSVQFPAPTKLPRPLTFKLETIQGKLPVASESAAVYYMPKKPANLLALTKTQAFAKRLQFTGEPIQQNKNIYRFVDTDYPLRTMQYDIISDNFLLSYAFAQDIGVFGDTVLPSPDAAMKESKNILQSWGLYVTDIAGGKTTTTYLKLEGDKLIPVSTRSLADAIRIDYFRKPIGKNQIVTPNPDEGPVSLVLVGSKTSKKNLLRLAFTLWPVDLSTIGTYALKTTETAWEELQTGKGYIARYPENVSEAVVRTVTIGYYDSFDPQPYLQPVFIFEGDNGFLGYVPAVVNDWIQ